MHGCCGLSDRSLMPIASRQPRRAAYSILILLAAIGGGIAWWTFNLKADLASLDRGENAIETPAAEDSTVVATLTHDRPSAQSHAQIAGSVRPAEVFPPINTPLASARDAWLAAAKRGNGEAAWRLTRSLQICQQGALIKRLVGARESNDFRDSVVMEEFLVLSEPLCAGIGGDLRPALLEAMLLGVQAGDVRARFQYLDSPPIPNELSIELADEWLQYRELAPRIATGLLAEGYVEISMRMAIGHDRDSGGQHANVPALPRQITAFAQSTPPDAPRRQESRLGQSLPDDDALAWRYARLCMRILDGYERDACTKVERSTAKRLSDSQRETLDAWVAAHPTLGKTPKRSPHTGMFGFL